MDIIFAIIIIFLIFVTCSVCGYCCKRNKQGIVYGMAGQPVVTTTSNTTQYQTSNPPYPVIDAPVSQTISAPPAGFAPHAAYPPTTPYPPAIPSYPPNVPQGFQPMPMPMPGGYTGAAPYPTMPMPEVYSSPVPTYASQTAANQLPPTYAEATRNRTVNEGYTQQSPYNPNFN